MYNPFMESMYIIRKNMGETPLEALERTRIEHEIPVDVPMTYAGRLDPLVEGLLIILTGDECKEKDKYNKFTKTYEFEILTGASTDSYDLLGLVTNISFGGNIEIGDIKKYLEDHKKTFIQNYPPYSSKTFEGKQLHAHAREGNTPTVEHEVALFDYEFLGEREILNEDLLKTIEERIGLVHGDFRQEEIIEKWKETLGGAKALPSHRITSWRVHVSGGFYIRQLVHDIGEHFSVPTVTFHIKRTKIGEFDKTTV